MNDALQAMRFAREVHAGQVRKYTGAPYADHLAEVAGIVSTISQRRVSIAVAWLHDCMEDQGVRYGDLVDRFGETIAQGVLALSDLETGNRQERKAASRARLARAPGWVQSIKCADLISNTASIVQHDPSFARVYLAEKRALLAVLTQADPDLRRIAIDLAGQFAPGDSALAPGASSPQAGDTLEPAR